MKLAAVVLLLVVVYAVALELLLPAWKRLAYTESAAMKSKSEFAKMMANIRSFYKRPLSVPNLNKP